MPTSAATPRTAEPMAAPRMIFLRVMLTSVNYLPGIAAVAVGSKWSARSKYRRQINDNADSRSAHRSLTRLCVDERQPRYRQPSHPAFDLTGVYLSFVRKRECCTTRKPSGYLRCEHLFKAVLNKASRPSSSSSSLSFRMA